MNVLILYLFTSHCNEVIINANVSFNDLGLTITQVQLVDYFLVEINVLNYAICMNFSIQIGTNPIIAVRLVLNTYPKVTMCFTNWSKSILGIKLMLYTRISLISGNKNDILIILLSEILRAYVR